MEQKLNILIDGYGLGQLQGTGITTYASELGSTLESGGHRVSALYGMNGISRRHQLQWSQFVQALSNRGEARPANWTQWCLYASWYYLHHSLYLPVRPSCLTRNTSVVSNSIERKCSERFNVFNKASIYQAAMAISLLSTRPLKMRIPGDELEIFHRTSPLPLYAANAANVLTIHDLIPLLLPHSTGIGLRAYRSIVDNALKHTDLIFSISEFTKKSLIEHCNVPEGKIHVTYQSVNIPEKYLNANEEVVTNFLAKGLNLKYGHYFLYYGALEPKKNVSRLLDAFALTKTDMPLVIAGKPGWLCDEELSKIRQIHNIRGGKRRLRRVEYLSYQNLMYLLKGARALVFPSLYEGFGLPVLEAMQMGVPVITSNATSLLEIGGSAAHYVDPYSIIEISTAIDKLAEDNFLRQNLVSKGLVQAQHFSQSNHLQRIQEGYQKVL